VNSLAIDPKYIGETVRLLRRRGLRHIKARKADKALNMS